MSKAKDAMTPRKWERVKHGANPYRRKPLAAAIDIDLMRPDYDAVAVEVALMALRQEELERHMKALA